jgi:phosphoglycolate phosphatase-like HAD superfamily hydrolase
MLEYQRFSYGVIFDLDETLVDTTPAKKELENEDWEAAKAKIPEFKLYGGIRELLGFINDSGIKTAIVSTSPHEYCKAVLGYFNIECHCIVGKEDSRKKPHADPMILAIEMIALEKNNIISMGDREKDIISSKKTGLTTIGCLWGTTEPEKLKHAGPHFMAQRPQDVVEILKKYFKIQQ